MIPTIKTLDYGTLEIRFDKTYFNNSTGSIIEDLEGNLYEIGTNFNGKLIALKLKD